MQGLSIANNLLANRVQYNLNKNQQSLQNTVTRLSSGLRINTAADDPSGLAISTNLQTQVDAFQQASQNVQDANNAAQVAGGALTTQTDILQRIHSLAVEASSSVNSSSDNTNLQSEITQLILEVNRVSQNTNFNGQPLLDGSHAGFTPYVDASYGIASNAVLANAGSSGGLGSGVQDGDMATPAVAPGGNAGGAPTGWVGAGNVIRYNGTGGLGEAPTSGSAQAVVLGSAPSSIQQTLTGLTPAASYQLNFSGGQGAFGTALAEVFANGVDVTPANIATLNNTLQSYTTQKFTADAAGNVTIEFLNALGAGSDFDVTNVVLSAVATGGDLVSGVTQITTTAGTSITSGSMIFDTTNNGAVDGTIELQVVNTSSTSVAVQVSFFTSSSSSASAITYYTSAAANSLVSVDGLNVTVGNVSTADAGTTAYIKVSQAVAASSSPAGPLTIQSGADEGDTVQIGIQATNAQTLRISNINVANTAAGVIAAEDAIGQVQNALQTLLAQQAQLGAVIVRLNEDANNDNVAAVNLEASESAIRDLNVGQATTDFTKLQVLVQVGTSILAQSNSNAQSVLGLFR